MANQLFKFNNGYEGIIHVIGGYQAVPYFENIMHKLDVHKNVYKAIEQIGVFRSGLTQLESMNLVNSSNLNMDGLLENNSVMNVRQNLITMLYRMQHTHPLATYFEQRLNELSKKWNIQPILN